MKDETYVYKYYSPREHNLDALKSGMLWFSCVEKLNDPFDLSGIRHNRHYKKLLQNIMESLYVSNKLKFKYDMNIQREFDRYMACSFSTSATNKLLWAYYAQSYEGWCVKFKVKDKSVLRDVIYLDNNLSYSGNNSLLASTPSDIAKLLLCMKSKDWQHEDEKRLLTTISYNENDGGLRDLNDFKMEIEEIIIGNRIKDDYREKIVEISNSLNIKISIIDINIDKDFNLLTHPINLI